MFITVRTLIAPLSEGDRVAGQRPLVELAEAPLLAACGYRNCGPTVGGEAQQ